MLCEGKVAVVTGAAGKGMGRSIALTLAREGAYVLVNYLTNANGAHDVIRYIEDKGGRALSFQADICRKDQCVSMVNAAMDKFGRVDICIINPGAGWHEESVDKLDTAGALDDINREIAPLYNLMPLVLPGMYERKCGRIIGISMEPSVPSPSYAYDAAKSARTHALRRAWVEAWKHGVTVNVITPGPVAAIDSLDEAVELCEHGQKWTERRNVTPQDIAEGVVMLCSESGRFIAGCELPFQYY